jgi:hypothetical protein
MLGFLAGGCGLDAVELAPGALGEVWLIDVDAQTAQRFASAREKPVPAGELALRSPVDGGLWPSNAPLGVAWYDKRPPGPKDSPRPCELTLRAGARQLRVYATAPFSVPAARLGVLLGDDDDTLTATLRCARDEKLGELSAAPAVTVTVGPALRATGLAVWGDGAVFSAPLDGAAQRVSPDVPSRYGFAVGASCSEPALLAGKGALSLPGAWATPSDLPPAVEALAVSADGGELALIAGTSLRVFDTATGAPRGERTIAELLPAAPVFADDGALYVAVSEGAAPKPMMGMTGGTIARVERGPGGELSEPDLSSASGSPDGPSVPGFWWSGALWATSAHGKLDAPKDARVVRMAEAQEAAVPPLDKASDSDPTFAESDDPALGYVLFASTRPLTTESPMPEASALWLSACSTEGECTAPLWWPLDDAIASPRRALFCAGP